MTGPPGPDGPPGYKGEKVSKHYLLHSMITIPACSSCLQGKCCLYAPTGYPVSISTILKYAKLDVIFCLKGVPGDQGPDGKSGIRGHQVNIKLLFCVSLPKMSC